MNNTDVVGKEDRAEAENEEVVAFPASDVSQGTNATAGSIQDATEKEEAGAAEEGGGDASAVDVECRSEATFPQQLMDVIEKETTNGTATSGGEKVLEWLPNGDAFIIRDKTLLEKEVLPKYFNIKCKFMSFVRKLYRYVLN